MKAEKSCQAVNFANVSQERFSRKISMKLSAQRIFKCVFLTLHPYYIYPHYPQKYERPFREKNPRQVFYNTNTRLQRESYSFLVRNHSNLFSFPFLLSYLEWRFVPKHNPHIFKVLRVFWSFGSFGDLPKEANHLADAIGHIARSRKLEKT